MGDYKLEVSKKGTVLFSVRPSDEGVKVSIKKDTGQKLRLNSLSYHKEIYRPCRLECEMVITAGLVGGYMPVFSEINDYLVDAVVKLYSDNGSTSNILADGYIIFDVTPVYSKKYKDTSRMVRVVAYSPDYKLTFAKYSKCHTAKKFLSEVVAGGLGDFQLGNLLNMKDGKPDISNLKFLTYKKSDKTLEYIQPYLVQYNETFHDFIVRVASRCGEYLYYENGKLNVGLVVKKKNEETLGKDGKTVKKTVLDVRTLNSVVGGVSYRKCSYDDSYGGTVDYRRDFVNSDSNYPSSSDKRVRDSELCQDDYMFSLTKDKFDSVSGELTALPHWANTLFSTLASSTSLYGLGTDFAMAMAKKLAIAGSNANKVNNAFNKTYFDDVNDGDDRKSGDNMKPYCSFRDESDKTLFNSFYEKVRKGEECVSRERIVVEIEPDSYDSLFLGDLIKTEQTGNAVFVVVRIDADKRYHIDDYSERVVSIGGVVGKLVNNKSSYWKRSVVVEAIPYTESVAGDGKPYPPLPHVPSFRFAAPQAAVISSADDPKMLGRVSIKYPWQGNGESASPFIRVATDRAGDLGSTFFKMGEGEEVLVGYMNGNVERPFVVGQYYTCKNKPMYGTRKFSTVIGSRNGHCVRIADPDNILTAVSSIFPPLQGLMGYTSSLKLGTKSPAGRMFMGSTEFTDNLGLNSISLNTQDRKVAISSVMGNVSVDAFCRITLSAPNGDIKFSGKNITLEAGNNITIHSGANVVKEVKYDSILDKIKSKAEETSLTIAGKVMDMVDISLFRCLYDTIIRPVDGTLRISSNRFVQVEAGKAAAEALHGTFVPNGNVTISDIQKSIVSISGFVDNLVNHFVEWKNQYIDRINNLRNDPLILISVRADKIGGIVNKLKQSEQENIVTDEDYYQAQSLYRLRVDRAVSDVTSWNSLNKPSIYVADELQRMQCAYKEEKVVGKFNVLKNDCNFLKDTIDADEVPVRETDFAAEALSMKRKLVFEVIKYAKDREVVTFEADYHFPIECPLIERDWMEMFTKISNTYQKPSSGAQLKEELRQIFTKGWSIQDRWNVDTSSKILFSDEEGRILEFDKGTLRSSYNSAKEFAVQALKHAGKDLK